MQSGVLEKIGGACTGEGVCDAYIFSTCSLLVVRPAGISVTARWNKLVPATRDPPRSKQDCR